MRATAVVSLAVAVALVAAAATAARPGGSSTIVAALNAERAANGIPADLRENTAWSGSCADHVAYMAAARRLTHVEEPGSPRYTKTGSWAGANSVLAVGRGWEAGDPFATAPLHLIQLMSPELEEIGVAEEGGYLCITTWPGYRPLHSVSPTVYTYPGAGAVGVPFAERADEQPFTPGEFVGLPPGATTGFDIMVFAEGIPNLWRARIDSATLVGPGGPVEVKTVDRATPTVGSYLPPGGGLMVPVVPLEAGTTYRASVRFAGGSRHTWSFTTAKA
jgi:Cysteine-rich secretory protein family